MRMWPRGLNLCVMRLFIGIALADAVTEELARLCTRLRRRDDELRWSAPQSWHITLQFLGNCENAQFECLQTHLSEIHSAPIALRLGQMNVFEGAGAFVVDVVLTRELIQLQRSIVAASAECGFKAEERPYHPHITLVRAKGSGRTRLRELKAQISSAPSLSTYDAREFLLYESHLGPSGSKYEVRSRFNFTEPTNN